MKEKLLLFVCCAPCAGYPVKLLKDKFDVTLLFYGPNIFPFDEYQKRLESAKILSKKLDVPLIELSYEKDRWQELVKGLEEEPEGGHRCGVCYRIRLEKTAEFAKENGYRYFGATLSASPYKPAYIINSIGEAIARKNGVPYLSEDFKKEDGFKKSCDLSREFGLYRQKYCGCEYSQRR